MPEAEMHQVGVQDTRFLITGSTYGRCSEQVMLWICIRQVYSVRIPLATMNTTRILSREATYRIVYLPRESSTKAAMFVQQPVITASGFQRWLLNKGSSCLVAVQLYGSPIPCNADLC